VTIAEGKEDATQLRSQLSQAATDRQLQLFDWENRMADLTEQWLAEQRGMRLQLQSDVHIPI
jgi:hypothetical protein